MLCIDFAEIKLMIVCVSFDIHLFHYAFAVESRFNKYDYQSITAIVSDMRLILENCYRYNGSGHWISKLAHKLEKIIDQKLALLNRFDPYRTYIDEFLCCFFSMYPLP